MGRTSSNLKTKTAKLQNTQEFLQTNKHAAFELLLHEGPRIDNAFFWENSTQMMKSEYFLDAKSFILSHNKAKNSTGRFYVSNDGNYTMVEFPQDLQNYSLVDFFAQFGSRLLKKFRIYVCYEVKLLISEEPDLIVPSDMKLKKIFGKDLSEIKISCCGNEMSLNTCQRRCAIEFADPNITFNTHAKDDEIFFYFGYHKITIKKSDALNKQVIRSKIIPFTQFKGHEGLKIVVIEENTTTFLPRANNLIKFKDLHIDSVQQTDGIRKGDRVAIVETVDCYGDSDNSINVYQFSPSRSFIYTFRVPHDLTVKEHILRYGIHDERIGSLECRFSNKSKLYYLAYSNSDYSDFWITPPSNTNFLSLTQKFSAIPTRQILIYYALSSPNDSRELYKLFKDKKPSRHSILYNHILSELYTTIRCHQTFKGLKVKNSLTWEHDHDHELWYMWNIMGKDPESVDLVTDVFEKLIHEWEGTGELYETIYLMVSGNPNYKKIELLLQELVNKMNLYLVIKPPEPLKSDIKRKRGDKSTIKEQRVIFNVPHDATLDKILVGSGLFTLQQIMDKQNQIHFIHSSILRGGSCMSLNATIPSIKSSPEEPLELHWKKCRSSSDTIINQFPSALTHHTIDNNKYEYFYKITKLNKI